MSGPAHNRKPRRPHKKSRNGCSECRRRRVKCDEKQPCCSGCMHRDASCHYPRSVESYSSPSRSQLEATSTPELRADSRAITLPRLCSASPPRFGTSAWRSIESRELELMHHWCTRTCHSFTPDLSEHFKDRVGKEALQYDFLMNALLALTSFHIATETGNAVTARSYTEAALRYHDQTISIFRGELQNITPATCNAVFATSAILAVCAVVSPFLYTNPGETKSIPETMLPLMDIVRGTGSIINASHQWLLQELLCGMIRGAVPRNPPVTLESFPAQELRRLNDMLINSGSHALDEADSAVRKHQIFEDAIQKLEEASEKGISMLPWLVKINRGFMEELRKEESIAVAIFMYWSVLLHRLDDMWWAKYSGKRLVRRLSATLDSHGNTWEQIIEWCRVQVELGPLSETKSDV